MNTNHYLVMFFISVLSGLLSTMNVWSDKWDDIRFSLNDLYMTLLMTGWMIFFMGLYYKESLVAVLGLALAILSILCIRTQFMISTKQFVLGMIPHHSMAVLMGKRLLEKPPSPINDFVKNIITTQEKEIQFMKNYLTISSTSKTS